MAYTDVASVRARVELGLTDETKYPDELIEILIKKATAIVNGTNGLNGSIELTPEFIVSTVNAVPNAWGGLHIQLPRRFITQLGIEVDEEDVFEGSIVIKYGYGVSDFTVPETMYQLNKELGYIDTLVGGDREYLFDMPTIQNFQAVVSYKAGIDPLPDDFLEAFYVILGKVVDGYNASSGTGEESAVSNKITEYRSLNETIKYATDKLKEVEAKDVLDDWVTEILQKYAMPDMGIGIRY